MSLSQACDERKNSELNVIIRDSAPEVIAITPLMTSMEMIPKHPKKSRDKRVSDEITPGTFKALLILWSVKSSP